jgi:hypothetical protein
VGRARRNSTDPYKELARLEKQYQIMQDSAEVQLRTALRGQLHRLEGVIQYELGDVLEELEGVEGDLARLIRARIRNVLRVLQTERRKLKP